MNNLSLMRGDSLYGELLRNNLTFFYKIRLGVW